MPIESLKIEFPDVPYAGHLDEPGYNAIFMKGGVVNSWVRDVTIENADNGVLTDTYSKWITVDGLTLEGRYGHHGLNVAHTADSLTNKNSHPPHSIVKRLPSNSAISIFPGKR